MKTIFRKVLVKDRLPIEDGDYFVGVKDGKDTLVSAMHFSQLASEIWKRDVVYWLEEIACTTESIEKASDTYATLFKHPTTEREHRYIKKAVKDILNIIADTTTVKDTPSEEKITVSDIIIPSTVRLVEAIIENKSLG